MNGLGNYPPPGDIDLAGLMSSGYGKVYGPSRGLGNIAWDEYKKAFQEYMALPRREKYVRGAEQAMGLMSPLAIEFKPGQFVEFQSPKTGEWIKGKIRDADIYAKKAWIFSSDPALHDEGGSVTISFDKIRSAKRN